MDIKIAHLYRRDFVGKNTAWRVVFVAGWKNRMFAEERNLLWYEIEEKIAVGTPNVFRRDIPLPNKTSNTFSTFDIQKNRSLCEGFFFGAEQIAPKPQKYCNNLKIYSKELPCGWVKEKVEWLESAVVGRL